MAAARAGRRGERGGLSLAGTVDLRPPGGLRAVVERRGQLGAWETRDRRDKGQGLLDVVREMYNLTACTTIESNEVNPPVLVFT